MASYSDIRYRVRSELSEISEITFSEEELFAYACEGGRLLHGIIATINPSFLLTGKKAYNKLSDYLDYEDMRWNAEFRVAARLSDESSALPDWELPEEYAYLDLDEDGFVTAADYNAILDMDVYKDGENQLHKWLVEHNKADAIDFSTLTIPDDCMFVYNMYIHTTGGRFKMVSTSLDVVMYYQAVKNTPSFFTRTGNQLIIAPFIDTPADITLYYIPAFMDPIDDITDFGLPETFTPFIVEYTILRAHNRNDRKTLVEQSFLNQKGELIQAILGREEVHLQTVPTLTNYPYISVR